jgi:hypothetical protein
MNMEPTTDSCRVSQDLSHFRVHLDVALVLDFGVVCFDHPVNKLLELVSYFCE